MYTKESYQKLINHDKCLGDNIFQKLLLHAYQACQSTQNWLGKSIWIVWCTSPMMSLPVLFYYWPENCMDLFSSSLVDRNRYLSRRKIDTRISSLISIWKVRYETKMTLGLLRKIPTFLSRSWASRYNCTNRLSPCWPPLVFWNIQCHWIIFPFKISI